MTISPPEPKTRLEMPLLLLCGMGLLAFFVAVGSIAYTVIALVSLLGHGPFTVNDSPVSKAEFIHTIWPILAFYPLGLLALGAMAYALWRERAWSRPAMMAFWLVAVAATIIEQFVTPEDIPTFIITVITLLLSATIAAWYLYRKRSVASYYRAVANRQVVPHTSRAANAGSRGA